MERVGGGVTGTLAGRYRKKKNEGVWKPAQQGAGQAVHSPFFGGQQPQTAPTYGGPGSPGAGASSYFGDPAYEMAKAFAARGRSEAQARALEKRKQAAIQFGDASGLEGALGGDFGAVSQQAAANPFSVLKNLEYGYNRGVGELEEDLNKANLFYSGYRGDQLANAAHQYQGAQYDARNQYRGLLSDIGDALSAALMQADYEEMMAALNAQLGAFPGGYQQPSAPPPQQQQPGVTHPYIPPQLKYGNPGQAYHPYLPKFY